jgi:glycosyltransferase involved in cell wall biosynthesis
MKVAVIDPSLFTLPYDQHLCAGLQATGVDVTLCGRAIRRGEALAPHAYLFAPRCYPWTEAGGAAPRGRVRALLKAAEHVITAVQLARWLQPRFDVLHFQWSPLPLVDAWHWRRLARARTLLFTVHDTTPFLDRPTSRGQKIGWRRLLDVAHGLIVHTESSRRDLERLGVDPRRIDVIPHGPLYPVGGPAAEAAGTAANPRGGRRTLLVFGEIKPYKGIDVLLRALARVAPEVASGWRLVVAGRPRCDLAPLRALAAQSRVPVEWRLGFVPDPELTALIRAADTVVFPYRRVDASGALMLALPLGAAVVATRVGVFREMLVDGVTAVLAAPDNETSLARALERAMRDDGLRARLRESVREQVRGLWSWSAIARAHVAAYRRHQNPWLRRADAPSAARPHHVPPRAVVGVDR